MVDKSWGVAGATAFRVRSNAGPADRAAERAAAREIRARERAEAVAQRLEARAAERIVEVAAREQARVERRTREEAVAARDPHAAAAMRRRGSGRNDVVREQRDTRSYATVVDADRIRALAGRGASIAGLAGAFGIGVEDVEEILGGRE